MARWQGGDNDGDGQRYGDGHHAIALRHIGNRRRYGNATAMTLMDGCNGDGNRWRNGNGDRRRDGEAMAMKSMDDNTGTGTLMDGMTATRWRQKAQWQRNGNNVDGLRGGNGDGWRDSNVIGCCNAKVVAMTVMDNATATAITR